MINRGSSKSDSIPENTTFYPCEVNKDWEIEEEIGTEKIAYYLVTKANEYEEPDNWFDIGNCICKKIYPIDHNEYNFFIKEGKIGEIYQITLQVQLLFFENCYKITSPSICYSKKWIAKEIIKINVGDRW